MFQIFAQSLHNITPKCARFMRVEVKQKPQKSSTKTHKSAKLIGAFSAICEFDRATEVKIDDPA